MGGRIYLIVIGEPMQFTRNLPPGLSPSRETAAALLGCAIVLALVLPAPQNVIWDVAYQLMAVKQYMAGQVPTINHLKHPVMWNLEWNSTRWLQEWPPGLNVIVHGLMTLLGLSMGASIRAIAVAMLILGAVGWARWVSLSGLSSRWRRVYAFGMPLLYYSYSPLFDFSCESFVFGLAPWLLISTDTTARELEQWREKRGSARRAFSQSVCFFSFVALLYVLKYSSVLITLGCVAYVMRAWIGTAGMSYTRWITLTLALAAVPILAVDLTGMLAGETPNRIFFPDFRASYRLLLPALTVNVMSLTGFEFAAVDIVKYLHSLDVLALERITTMQAAILAIPGGIGLLWILATQRGHSRQFELMRVVLAFQLALFIGLWSFKNTGAGYNARYIATTGAALLPLLAELLLGDAYSRRGGHRLCLRAILGIYVAFPALYGALYLARKSANLWGYTPSVNGLYSPWLSGKGGYIDLVTRYAKSDPYKEAWYTFNPILALELPGRVQIKTFRKHRGDFLSPSESIHSPMPVRLHLLIPRAMEVEENILRAVPQAEQWSRTEIGEHLVKWSTWIAWYKVRERGQELEIDGRRVRVIRAPPNRLPPGERPGRKREPGEGGS